MSIDKNGGGFDCNNEMGENVVRLGAATGSAPLNKKWEHSKSIEDDTRCWLSSSLSYLTKFLGTSFRGLGASSREEEF